MGGGHRRGAGDATVSATISIAGRTIGEGHPAWVCAEAGINHQGDIGIMRDLIVAAERAGCDSVKTQKRTVEAVYTEAELAQVREGPWGRTNGDLKRLLEFDADECRMVRDMATTHRMTWSASPWDLESVQVLADLEVEWVKVASASITDRALVRACSSLGVPVIMSTGMSTTAEIDRAVEWASSAPGLALLHTCSAYPSAVADLHLSRIEWLRERYPHAVVGYSGHETGVLPSVEAVRLGASIVERHVTLDRGMWGSDQGASLEPEGLRILVASIRCYEAQPPDVRAFGPLLSALIVEAVKAGRSAAYVTERVRSLSSMFGTPGERSVLPAEEGPRKKLRRVG